MSNGDVQQPVDPQQPVPPTPPPPTGPKDNTAMLVLSYIWLLALIPLLVEKEDPEVQWHAKQGLILTVAEIVLVIIFRIGNSVLNHIPGVGCVTSIVGCFIPSLVWVGFTALRIVCIVKATKHEKFLIPVISDYANKM